MMNEPSPSEKYQLPVIGKIRCQLRGIMNNQPFISEIDEHEVIKVINNDNETITYVCNSWNSPGVVQVVPDICVIEFIRY